MAIQPKMRPARSPAKNGDSERSRTCPSHASAVAATRIGSAQALESSYGPVASGSTRSGTPSTTEQRPTKTGERGDQRPGASGPAEEVRSSPGTASADERAAPSPCERAGSDSAFASNHDGDRAEQNLEIEAQRPAVHVEEVHLHPPLEVHGVPPTDLPEAGDPGSHGEAPALRALDLTRLVHRQWPRPHQAHLALEDIEELGELVEGKLPEEPAGAGAPRVTRRLEDRPGPVVEVVDLVAHPLRVLDHGPELVHQEAPAVEPGALLAEDDRPAGGELDRERDGQEERERHDEEDRCAHDVERPLGGEDALARQGGREAVGRQRGQLLDERVRLRRPVEVHEHARVDPEALAQLE